MYIDHIPLSLLLDEQTQLSQPFLSGQRFQSLESSLWLFAGLPPVCPWVSCTEEPELDPVQQAWSHQCWVKGRNRLLQLDKSSFSDADRDATCHLSSEGSYSTLCPPGLPGPFLTSCFGAEWPHQHRGEMMWFSRVTDGPTTLNITFLYQINSFLCAGGCPAMWEVSESRVLVFSYQIMGIG